MGCGNGSFEARKSERLEAPIPPGRSRSTLKLTVLEDESRAATIGRVALRALVALKNRRRQHSRVVPAQ
jgi:hypothetical protein